MAAEDKDLNRDPITDEPGAHPVGTGVGAAGGAVAGAAAGSMAGPIGAAVGGVVGAVVGGLAGKAAGEAVNPTAEEAHWRDNYQREPYYEQGRTFDDYGPAYRLGVNSRSRYEDWDSAEPQLASEWESSRAGSSLSWPQAKHASRAAWDRLETNRLGSPGMDGTRDSQYTSGVSDASGSSMGTTGSSMGATGSTMGTRSNDNGMGSSGTGMGSGTGGAAGMVGQAQSAGNMSGDSDDVVEALNDLAECSKDGEYGFRACAEQAKDPGLKSTFLQRADDCRRGAQELYEQIRACGGKVDEGGSAAGAVHRGWVSVKATLSTYDDKAILEEAERGEDNAMARYRKALKQPLPAGVKLIVERQMQGVQRNHDEIKRLRNQFRGA